MHSFATDPRLGQFHISVCDMIQVDMYIVVHIPYDFCFVILAVFYLAGINYKN